MMLHEQTVQQIEDALKSAANSFPRTENPDIVTDIHLQALQDSGELVIMDDDDNELERCIIDEWIDAELDNFYEKIIPQIRKAINNQRSLLDNLSILKPYSFILINEEKDTICELYIVDDDTIIVDDDLLDGLDNELDDFMNDLLKE
jgi:hypothetical protein